MNGDVVELSVNLELYIFKSSPVFALLGMPAFPKIDEPLDKLRRGKGVISD